MSEYIAKRRFRFRGELVEPGNALDLTGYSSRTIARLVERDLAAVIPTAAGEDDGNIVVIDHGGDGTVERPPGQGALWRGTSEPTNAEEDDLWLDTT